MKIKWGKGYIKGFAKEVLTAERQHWFWKLTDYIPAFVLITCVVVIVWIWVKIYQLWMIKAWLDAL